MAGVIVQVIYGHEQVRVVLDEHGQTLVTVTLAPTNYKLRAGDMLHFQPNERVVRWVPARGGRSVRHVTLFRLERASA